MKKYFVFSDVHGDYDALMAALSGRGFDEENDNHILISLGDLWDRGEQNFEVAEFAIKFWKLGRMMSILGNHDEFLELFLINKDDFNIRNNGFDKTLNQWAKTSFLTSTIPFVFFSDIYPKIVKNLPDLEQYIASMVDEITLGKYVLTHAGLDWEKEKGWYPNNQTNTPLFVKFLEDVPTDKVYIFGHWNTPDLAKHIQKKKISYDSIFQYKNFIGIDTTSIFTKKVNVVVIEEADGEFELSL